MEQIRLSQADQGGLAFTCEILFDTATAAESYQQAFRAAGLDVLALDVSDAAAQIRESGIRETIITGLDNWMRSF